MSQASINLNSVSTDKKSKSYKSHKSDKSDSRKSDSRKSHKSEKRIKIDREESDDISLSKLEILANKDKLNDDSKSKSSVKSAKSSESHHRHKSHHRSHHKSRRHDDDKENRSDVKKEKMALLYKLSKIYAKNGINGQVYTMDNTLEDIKTEYDRLNGELKEEQGVAMCKKSLLFGISILEFANNTFDPIGLELEGWSEAMSYSLENQEYDSVLTDLYEKYKDSVSASPEIRLILMIGMSGAMFHASKKMNKVDPNQIIGNLFNNISKNTKASTKFNPHQESDDVERPSKINDPDSIDIDKVLKQMQQNKQQEHVVKTPKEIVVIPTKKGRGRPRKNA